MSSGGSSGAGRWLSVGKSPYWLRSGSLRHGSARLDAEGLPPEPIGAGADEWPKCRKCSRRMPEGRFGFCSNRCSMLYHQCGFNASHKRPMVRAFFEKVASLIESDMPPAVRAALEEFLAEHKGAAWSGFESWFTEELCRRITGRRRV